MVRHLLLDCRLRRSALFMIGSMFKPPTVVKKTLLTSSVSKVFLAESSFIHKLRCTITCDSVPRNETRPGMVG